MAERGDVERLLEMSRTLRLQGDVEGLAELFHEAASFQVIGVGHEVQGRDAIRAALHQLVATFEFIEIRPLQLIVDGDTAGARYGFVFRHRPSDTTAEAESFDFFTVRDGKFATYVQHSDSALAHRLMAHPATA